MQLKKWYHSKTILLNISASLLAILPVFDVSFLTLIGVSDPVRYFGIIGGVTTILNIVLRTQNAAPSAPIQTKARKENNEL